MTQRTAGSRAEQQARTRADLLAAATELFARHGYHGTSVDMVAGSAGYTKGAVYSNFESKEELFLALLDQRMAESVAGLERTVAGTEPAERSRAVGEQRGSLPVYDRDWVLLELEFALYAARNDDVRERMGRRQAESARRIVALVERHFAESGIGGEVAAPDDVAQLLIAAADGLALMELTRPEVDGGRLLALLVRLLERGAAG